MPSCASSDQFVPALRALQVFAAGACEAVVGPGPRAAVGQPPDVGSTAREWLSQTVKEAYGTVPSGIYHAENGSGRNWSSG